MKIKHIEPTEFDPDEIVLDESGKIVSFGIGKVREITREELLAEYPSAVVQ